MNSNRIPRRIARIEELAYNLWWTWNEDVRELFEAIDATLWDDTEHNPVKLLHEVPEERLAKVATDPAFVKRYDAVLLAFDEMLAAEGSWMSRRHPDLAAKSIAYFSAEFGLHNSLPIYSGGLGVLAGDHCKEASDLGVSVVGVGFMYPRGYFRQRISSSGWQEQAIEVVDWGHAPIRPVKTATGERLCVSVAFAARSVQVAAYEVVLGRGRLLLLDTDLEANDPWDRDVPARLYGGDQRTRIAQEILLGIGGVRLLRALSIDPAIWHANEGHVAFMMLERLREHLAAGVSFETALERVRATTVFTTHTPVPAGHDAFPLSLLEDSFRGYWDGLEPLKDRCFALGEHQESWGKSFNMTVFSLRTSGHRNAVSELHGKVSRKMWRGVFADRPENHVPISSVTNGVHVPTWVAPRMAALLSRTLGPDWLTRHDEPALWEDLVSVRDDQLWRVHLQLKRGFVGLIRERARLRWMRGLTEAAQLLAAGTLLDPEALTIGFARRFATYKRATLIFHDVERLFRMLEDPWRPLQIVFAGKAHPADEPGKHLIREVYERALDRKLGARIAFVDDYDLHVSKFMVSGVDVWLNTPRPPMEACGTSGQKAGLNGVPHLSVLDGWWYEGYRGGNGFAFGQKREDAIENDDALDAQDLYRVLSEEVIPLYYARDSDNVPRGWVELMKEAMRSAATRFSARRMIKQYVEQLYLPAMRAPVAPATSVTAKRKPDDIENE
jgi:starch phosphorylase